MKKWGMIVLIGCLFVIPSLAQAQLQRIRSLERFFGREESRIRPEDLKVVQLEISPDPVRQGQRVVFRVTISNGSRYSGRVTLAIKDKDEIISEVRDALLRPGDNQVSFPESSYRFSRSDHCFTVEADIERTRSPIDTSREFCAKRTNLGWTLSDKEIGPLYVEDLEMNPDPAAPGQEIRFRIRLRNDGRDPSAAMSGFRIVIRLWLRLRMFLYHGVTRNSSSPTVGISSSVLILVSLSWWTLREPLIRLMRQGSFVRSPWAGP